MYVAVAKEEAAAAAAKGNEFKEQEKKTSWVI